MATKSEIQAADYRAEATNGLRTERVVLQIAHWGPESAARWDFAYCFSELYALESVRVVEDEERQAPPTTKTATTENDYVPPAPVSRPAETRQTQAERVGGGWWFPKYDKPSSPPPPPPAPPRVHRGSGVFDASGDEVPWEGVVATLTDERDAAIRELSAEKVWRDNLAMQRNEIRDERDALKARVAELEAASGGGKGEP
jgi:hypothetical protein